jgi:hypothetical protein
MMGPVESRGGTATLFLTAVHLMRRRLRRRKGAAGLHMHLHRISRGIRLPLQQPYCAWGRRRSSHYQSAFLRWHRAGFRA